MADEKKYEGLWNDAMGPTIGDEEDEYAELVLDQYREYVQTAEATSERRLRTNAFFLTLNTALIAGVSYVLTETDSTLARLVAVAGSAASIWMAFVWIRLLRAYRAINSAKFEVIGDLEQRLPASPFWNAEWEILGRPGSGYKSLAQTERWIPIVIICMQAFVFIAGVVSFRQPIAEAPKPVAHEVSLDPVTVHVQGTTVLPDTDTVAPVPDSLVEAVQSWVVRAKQARGEGEPRNRERILGPALELATKLVEHFAPAVSDARGAAKKLAERLADLVFETAVKVDPNLVLEVAREFLGLWVDSRECGPVRILFDAGSDEVPLSGRLVLRELAHSGSGPIVLVGSTDRVGKDDANERLAERRVLAAREVLLELGYDPKLISLESTHESAAPIATPDDVSEPVNRAVTVNPPPGKAR